MTYVSGGVGSDESQPIKEAMPNYPLVLEFAGRTSYGKETSAWRGCRIVDAHGKTVLDTSAQGPFLLVSLPAGRYAVAASYGEKTEHRSVSLLPSGHVRELILWPT
ncbi:carboxypeptidase regulatory-like domain-containing protein [Cupriavidus sp. 8B]